jgi:hypothetical protein
LKSKGLSPAHWEVVLAEALHYLRSLLHTSTNQTPHERLFNFARKSSSTNTLPDWLIEKGKALLKRHVKSSKYEDFCDEFELLETNPTHVRVKLPNGVDKTVSLRDLAPLPGSNSPSIVHPAIVNPPQSQTCCPPLQHPYTPKADITPFSDSTVTTISPECPVVDNPPETPVLTRRSQRSANPPDRLICDKLGG